MADTSKNFTGGGRFAFKDMPIGGVVVLSTICVAGIIGNLLIIGAVMLNRSLRKRNNTFIVNLALADLIVTAFIMPVLLSTTRRALDMTSKTPGEDKLCDAVSFLVLTTMLVSTLSLTTVAVERYFNVCHSHKHQRVFTVPVTSFLVGLIWAVAIAVATQGFTGWAKFAYIKRMFACFYVPKGNASFNLFMATICFFIPLPVMLYCYGRIFWVYRVSRKKVGVSSKNNLIEKRLLFTLLAIVCVYFVCWGVLACLWLAISLVPSLPDWLGPTAFWLAISNSSMNTFIYGLMNTHFRAGYKMTLQRIASIFPCCPHVPSKIELANKSRESNSGNSTDRGGSDGTAEFSFSSGSGTKDPSHPIDGNKIYNQKNGLRLSGEFTEKVV